MLEIMLRLKKFKMPKGISIYNQSGWKHSEITIKKLSNVMKGKIRGPLSEEHKRKLVESNIGRHPSEETKLKISKGNKGHHIISLKERKLLSIATLKGWEKYKNTPEYFKRNKKISIAKQNIIFTTEHKKNISKAKLGKKFNITLDQHKKLSLCRIGEKNGMWKGGKSFEPYSVNWNNILKRNIRERDNYMCKLCGKLQDKIRFHVHHIDYNKKNCNPENLITLCKSCHMKTNHNREYYINYFTNKLRGMRNVSIQFATS